MAFSNKVSFLWVPLPLLGPFYPTLSAISGHLESPTASLPQHLLSIPEVSFLVS